MFHVILLGLFVVASTAETVQQSEPQISNPTPHSLQTLGTIGEKTYYVENNVSLDWFEAREYCHNADLELATIQSEAEFDWLMSKYNNATFAGHYWSGGRDKQIYSQFVWDRDGGIDVGSYAFRYWTTPHPPYQSCVQIYSRNPDSGLHLNAKIAPCTVKEPVLCESV